jgi:vitamin B12 transporter
MDKRVFFIIFILVWAAPSLAQDSSYTLEPIVVTSHGAASQDNYSEDVLSGRVLQEQGSDTLSDSLGYAPGVDLRYRGKFGIQGDLSLRGSTFEQEAVLIDGIKINDPQTGHYNLDLPLTSFDVDRIEIFKEGLSSRFGSGAFAGAVNIHTKRPVRRALNSEALFGEHALFGQGISVSVPEGDMAGRVSFEHKISKGDRPNTDFEYRTTSVYLIKENDLFSLDGLFGYQKKDYGASTFYSNLFPAEEEHTQTLFFKSGLECKELLYQPTFNIFLRQHLDKFILDRNNPVFVNYHTTYVYGLNSQAEVPSGWGSFLPGFDLAEEEINSSKLGKHGRFNIAPSLAFDPDLGDKFNADIRARLDHYTNLSWQESYNAAIGYNVSDQFKVRGSLGRAFRIPTFTELYYSDPGNIGNPHLSIERSDNFRLGIDFQNEYIEAGLEGFYRKGRNLIDWIRTSSAKPWQATNLGKADFRGAEFQLKFKECSLSYTYTDVAKAASGFFSKYALDVLKNQLILGLNHKLLGLNSYLQLSYNERYYAKAYFLADLYISKTIKCRDYSFEPFIKIDNLTDADYSEIGGVLQPGRWIQGGVKLEW